MLGSLRAALGERRASRRSCGCAAGVRSRPRGCHGGDDRRDRDLVAVLEDQILADTDAGLRDSLDPSSAGRLAKPFELV